MKEHSKCPLRSDRISHPETERFVNNRIDLFVRPGTYKLQAIGNLASNSDGVFFAVSKSTAIIDFPAGTTHINARGEFLMPGGVFKNAQTAGLLFLHAHAVEVDVMEGQSISFWSINGTETIKYVRVGDLPSADPQLEGGRK